MDVNFIKLASSERLFRAAKNGKSPLRSYANTNGDFSFLTIRIRLYCMLLGICSNVVFAHIAPTQPILHSIDRGEKDGETRQATQATGKSLWVIIAAVHYMG